MSEAQVNASASVSLREITWETVNTILKLDVAEGQKKFVAPNSVSIAQAHFSDNAWFRAIYADETPVGFLMLYDSPEKSEYFLWRLMVGAKYQGNGFGRRAIELLTAHVKTRPGAKELRVSHALGQGNPEPFYKKLGFEHTGEELHGELVMRLPL